MDNKEINPLVLEAYDALANLQNKITALVDALPYTSWSIQVDTVLAVATAQIRAGLQWAVEALAEEEEGDSEEPVR